MSTSSSSSCQASRKDVEHLQQVLKQNKVCMFTTIDSAGQLHSRPMYLVGGLDCDCAGDRVNELSCSFFSKDNSAKVKEMNEKGQKVNLTFGQGDKQGFVSVSGCGQVICDNNEVKKKWEESQDDKTLKSWFPNGPKESNICIVKVKLEKAEYWTSFDDYSCHCFTIGKSATSSMGASSGKAERKEDKPVEGKMQEAK